MLPRSSIITQVFLLTGVDLLLRGISMAFQIYLSSKIGAAGLGLLQLIVTVGALGSTLGLSGVRTAALYLCAEEHGKRRPGGVRRAMELCLLWGVVCSLAAAAALFFLSDTLAAVWLRDARAASGLRILALSLPLNCLVCVLGSYFTVCGKLRRLVSAEIAAQLVSIAFTVFFLTRIGGSVEGSCRAVLLGSLAATILSACWLLLLLRRDFRAYGPAASGLGLGGRLVRLCVPLAFGDYLRSGLRTLEQLLIPIGLSRAVGSSEAAMAAYGTIHAMVFPILMFPAAILYSLSDLLVPELARCNAAGRTERIRSLCERCLRLTVLFACAVSALQLLLAEPLGLLFYKSREAGRYLRLFAPMVLILYPDAIVDAMCKGLGKQVSCVRNNTLTSILDVALLYFLLPRLGLNGYLFTFAATHTVNFFLSLRLLMDASGCGAQPRFLLKAALSLLLASAAVLALPQALGGLPRILCAAAVFLLLYLPALYLTDALTPEDRRWLRRKLRAGQGH